MNLLNQATTTVRKRGQKILLFGPEGSGKTTFGSKFPNVYFLDLEDSTAQLDGIRTLGPDKLPTLDALKQALSEFKLAPAGFASTVVIDTGDYMEYLIEQYIIKQGGNNISCLADFGYGKGHEMLKEEMERILGMLDLITARGINVLVLCHVQITSFSPPGGAGAYNRYEINLGKKCAPLLKAWADMVLFGNYDVMVSKGNDGKLKATGGKERTLQCQWTVACDAKNRHGLNAVEPWDLKTVEKAFQSIGMSLHGKPATAPATITPSAALKAQAERQGAKAEAPKPTAPPPDELDGQVASAITGLEDAVTANYLKNGRLAEGQTWKDLPRGIKVSILKNPEGFRRMITGVKEQEEATKAEERLEEDSAAADALPTTTEETTPDPQQEAVEASTQEVTGQS